MKNLSVGDIVFLQPLGNFAIRSKPDYLLEAKITKIAKKYLYVRNLVHDGAILFNPVYLDLQEIIDDEELKCILSPLQYKLYSEAAKLSERDKQEIADEIEN